MDTEELKEKYRSFPVVKRYGIMMAVGLLFPVYFYMEESEVVNAEVQAAKQSFEVAKSNLSKRKQQKANIPKKEKEISQLETKLIEIRRVLPNKVLVHDILREVELSAQDLDIDVISFDPGEKKSLGLYSETPFKILVRGKFTQVMRFSDSLLHFEYLTHIDQMNFSRSKRSGKAFEGNATDYLSNLKEKSEVDLTFMLMAFENNGLN